MAKMALAEAVADAVDKHSGETSDETTTETETSNTDKTGTDDTKTDTTGEQKETTESTETIPVLDEDTQFAVNLVNSLRDPAKAFDTLQAIAKQFGAEVRRGEATKQEAAQTIQQILDEGLGAEYNFLSQKFGPVLEKLFTQELNRRIAPATNKILELEARNVNSEITRELADLSTRTKGASGKLEDHLIAWMSKYQPAPNSNVTVREFLDDAYASVSQNDAVKSSVLKKVEKINKNATEANVASTGSTSEMETLRTTGPNKKFTAGDAVRLAMQGKRVQR